MSKTVLVVDDSNYMRSIICKILKDEGYEIVAEADTGEEAINMALKFLPDLITLDNVLPDMLGLDIVKILKMEEQISSRIVMVSAVGQDSVVEEGLELGAEAYILKPFTPENFVTSINKLFE